MSSKSSSESTPKIDDVLHDVGVIYRNHKKLSEHTNEGFTIFNELDEAREKQIRKLRKTTNVLAFAVIVMLITLLRGM